MAVTPHILPSAGLLQEVAVTPHTPPLAGLPQEMAVTPHTPPLAGLPQEMAVTPHTTAQTERTCCKQRTGKPRLVCPSA